jgi:hypothetical protein
VGKNLESAVKSDKEKFLSSFPYIPKAGGKGRKRKRHSDRCTSNDSGFPIYPRINPSNTSESSLPPVLDLLGDHHLSSIK